MCDRGSGVQTLFQYSNVISYELGIRFTIENIGISIVGCRDCYPRTVMWNNSCHCVITNHLYSYKQLAQRGPRVQ